MGRLTGAACALSCLLVILAVQTAAVDCRGKNKEDGVCQPSGVCNRDQVVTDASGCPATQECCKQNPSPSRPPQQGLTRRLPLVSTPPPKPHKSEGASPSGPPPQRPRHLSLSAPPSLGSSWPQLPPASGNRFLFIDGDDAMRRMARYKTEMGDAFHQLDVVTLEDFDFDDLRSRITKQYEMVFFTMHGANAGHAHPSVLARGTKVDETTVRLHKKYGTRQWKVVESADTNPLHLSGQSVFDFMDDDVGAERVYRVGYLYFLYDLVRHWSPPPVIVLFVCNKPKASITAEREKPPSHAPTGIKVYYPAKGCVSSRELNALVLRLELTKGGRSAHEIAEELDAWYDGVRGARYEHSDMAELIDVESQLLQPLP